MELGGRGLDKLLLYNQADDTGRFLACKTGVYLAAREAGKTSRARASGFLSWHPFFVLAMEGENMYGFHAEE